MLRFRCPKCSVKLTAREDRAGKTAACPHCKSKIAIPSAQAPSPAQLESTTDKITFIEPAKAPDKPATDPLSPPQADELDADARQHDEKLLISLGITPLPQHTGERQLPWLIDVLLYPTSQAGLTCMAVIVIAPLAAYFIRRFFGPFGAILLGWPIFLGSLVIGLYVIWYMAECAYDSARGGTRAPDAFGLKVGFTDVGARIIYIAAVYGVYVVPVIVYLMLFRRVDAILLALAVWAVLFFPMSLLAMVLHDSTFALNPLFLLGSIFRTFFQYAGLLLLLLAATSAVAWIILAPSSGLHIPSIWLTTARMAISTYIVFLMTHILGRFYWRNRERLDWGI